MARSLNQLRWKLKKVGVDLVDPHTFMLACADCGRHWSPILGIGGRPRRRYRLCPYYGCNAELLQPEGQDTA